jgi:hypothetical protein
MVFFRIFRIAHFLLRFLNTFYTFKFFICDITKLDRNEYKLVIPINDFFFKNNFGKKISYKNKITFQYLYASYLFFLENSTNDYTNSFKFTYNRFSISDSFYSYTLLNFFIFNNFANCSFIIKKNDLYRFIRNDFFNFFFVMFNVFRKFTFNDIQLANKLIYINFKSYWSLFNAVKYENLRGIKRNDQIGSDGVKIYRPNFNKLYYANIKKWIIFNPQIQRQSVYFRDTFVSSIKKLNKGDNLLWSVDTSDDKTYKINYAATSCQKDVIASKIKHYDVLYLRKIRVFNKGRYSRTRQIYRTGVYWCLYVNIFAVLGLYYFFYKFTINFGYLWWFLGIFISVFALNKFIKNKYYLYFNFLPAVKSFLTWNKIVLTDLYEIICFEMKASLDRITADDYVISEPNSADELFATIVRPILLIHYAIIWLIKKGYIA